MKIEVRDIAVCCTFLRYISGNKFFSSFLMINIILDYDFFPDIQTLFHKTWKI